MLFFACRPVEEEEIPVIGPHTVADLVGSWEAFETIRDDGTVKEGEPSFLFGYYGSAITLREAMDYDIYYWRHGPGDQDRSIGTWTVEEGKNLVLNPGSTGRTEINILSLEGDVLEIFHRFHYADTFLNTTFRMRKN